MSKQVDAYSLYEAGARELLNRIGEDHPLYPNALGYQHRLRENLEQCQPHDETDTLRAERNRIINELNKLAVSVLGISFRELCEQVECIKEQEPTECLPHINDPLSLVEFGAAGPALRFLEDVEKARSYSNCEEALQLCDDAVEYASKHGNQAQLALAYLYQADAHARHNRLQTGVKLAERARRILKIWGDRHNTMVAQLLIARLQVSHNSNDARRK